MTFKNKAQIARKIVSYLQATDNEIAIDLLSYKILNIKPTDFGHFPRPINILHIFNKLNIVKGKILLNAIYYLWIFGFSFLYNCFQLFYSLLRIKFYKNKIHVLNQKPTFNLAFSLRATQIIPEVKQNIQQIWISFPWVKLNSKEIYAINIFSFLSINDLFISFHLSNIAVRKLFFRSKNSHSNILQSYTAYNWFLARIALEKLQGNFVIAEHYDRWAVLVDSMVFEKNHLYKNGKKEDFKFTLFQHGIIGIPSNLMNNDFNLSLKYKLECVTELFVYDIDSKNLFIKKVLSSNCTKNLNKINFKEPSINIRLRATNASLIILFVGHPACEQLHVHLYKKLKCEFDFKAYYKPHPLKGISKLINDQDWIIINDKSFYPSVDHLVSYPSTLVIQYAKLKITSSVHPLGLAAKNSTEFIETIKRNIVTVHNSSVSFDINI